MDAFGALESCSRFRFAGSECTGSGERQYFVRIFAFWRAFSKKATREDQIEERDERNRLIRYKSKARMLDIAYGILFVFMVCGMIGFKLTANPVWFAILVLPGLFLGGFLILEICVQLYYEKHE